MKKYSFLVTALNRLSMAQFRGLTRAFRINQRRLDFEQPTLQSLLYSAAATSEGFFGAADDMMKSEIRGTISDLKREPLKTP
jgi:hypothetical protein